MTRVVCGAEKGYDREQGLGKTENLGSSDVTVGDFDVSDDRRSGRSVSGTGDGSRTDPDGTAVVDYFGEGLDTYEHIFYHCPDSLSFTGLVSGRVPVYEGSEGRMGVSDLVRTVPVLRSEGTRSPVDPGTLGRKGRDVLSDKSRRCTTRESPVVGTKLPGLMWRPSSSG